MAALLSRQRIVAAPGYNRWWVPLASVAIHLCIGSVYAWSIYNPALVRTLGVVAPAAGDWSLQDVTWIFSVAIVFLGLSAAFAGRWLELVGPRMVGVVAAFSWGGGYLLGSIGILTHQLWLLYLGYGVIGGCGLGLGYVSPVSTLIRWFPDRRGMATGMAIMGFGGGAIIGAPLKRWLMQSFYEPPQYLGTLDQVTLVTEGGRRYMEARTVAEAGGRVIEEVGPRMEVVVVGVNDVAGMLVQGAEGVYAVGTGSIGVAQTFMALGLIYFVIMLLAAFSYRIPAAGWRPAGWTPPAENGERNNLITQHHVDIDQALRTPQFWQLWIVLCMNVSAGIGVLGVASTMMSEIFGTTLPGIVDGAFAATYVMMISIFNMSGRFIWASLSDYIGRKTTYWVFFALGIVLYCSVPFAATQVGTNPNVVWLLLFYGATMLIFTMYGGGFATIPAYLADVFGTKFVGGIHGRLLTAWSTAGVVGPLAITSLRQTAVARAIEDLAARVDPAAFQQRFGAGLDQLDELVAAQTVTIARLMEIAPPGTLDPTSALYNSTMYLMAALLAVGLLSNALMKPVDSRHHLQDEGSTT